MRLLDTGMILCLGLFPVLHLRALQIALILILIGCLLRVVRREPQHIRFSAPHFALLQGCLFFLVNALIFAPLPGTPDHFKPVAIEALSTAIIGLFLLWYYLGDGRNLYDTWQRWLPVGLLISWLALTYEYLFVWDGSGYRASGLAPNALGPPQWFLVLAISAFAGYRHMSSNARMLRFALMGAGALLVMYSGARMTGLAWIFSLFCISIYLVHLSPEERRGTLTRNLSIFFLIVIVAIYVLDQMGGGVIEERVLETLDGLQNESTTFFRLELWRSALQSISDTTPWGAGQINERILVSSKLEEEHWLRAHQTYLSYMIAGGWLALFSGLWFQAAPLLLWSKSNTRDTMPAILGLAVVMALGGLTDSVFQSYVNMQAYLILTLIIAALKPAAYTEENTIKT